MKNILIAIDFDDTTQHLIQFAVHLAKPFDAKLWLVHVAETDPEFLGFADGPQYIRDAFAKGLREEHRNLQELCEKVKKMGVDAEGLMMQGSTIELLLEEASKLGVDMIMTATHKRSFIYKAFVGSVSEELFRRTSIPLLAFPAV